MIVATRILLLSTANGEKEISVNLFRPERDGIDWRCRFQIDWPDAKAERWGAGVDSVQALISALQMIGAEIYASDYHQSGRLIWYKSGNGYGFPVPKNLRSFLVGDDAVFDG